MFQCDGCGYCCENLHLNDIMQDMHDGNGICYFFNASSRQCNIYKHRPLVCRVDDFFNLILMKKMSQKDYYQANKHFCDQIKNIKKEY